MKTVRVHFFFSYLCFFILVLSLTSCSFEKEKNCIPLKKTIKVDFTGKALIDICFSPFEAGKVWVKTQKQEVIEIDDSGNKLVLDKKLSRYFFSYNTNGRLKYIYPDQFDSLIWVGRPSSDVEYYDQRTKKFHSIPVRHARRIIPRPGAVYFVSLSGFSYWDRSTKKSQSS